MVSKPAYKRSKRLFGPLATAIVMVEEGVERYLRRIVFRYRDAINLSEQKSLVELKEMVSPDQKELDLFPVKDAAEAFDAVRALSTIHASLPVSFWLTFVDMKELSSGDPLDKGRLLTSMLLRLHEPAWLRVVQLEGGGQHPIVWLDKKPVECFDVMHSLRWNADSIELAIAAYPGPHKIRLSLYEFSHKEYRDL